MGVLNKNRGFWRRFHCTMSRQINSCPVQEWDFHGTNKNRWSTQSSAKLHKEQFMKVIGVKLKWGVLCGSFLDFSHFFTICLQWAILEFSGLSEDLLKFSFGHCLIFHSFIVQSLWSSHFVLVDQNLSRKHMFGNNLFFSMTSKTWPAQ